eukprot:1727472-Amphidinium_carterae.1
MEQPESACRLAQLCRELVGSSVQLQCSSGETVQTRLQRGQEQQWKDCSLCRSVTSFVLVLSVTENDLQF